MTFIAYCLIYLANFYISLILEYEGQNWVATNSRFSALGLNALYTEQRFDERERAERQQMHLKS